MAFALNTIIIFAMIPTLSLESSLQIPRDMKLFINLKGPVLSDDQNNVLVKKLRDKSVEEDSIKERVSNRTRIKSHEKLPIAALTGPKTIKSQVKAFVTRATTSNHIRSKLFTVEETSSTESEPDNIAGSRRKQQKSLEKDVIPVLSDLIPADTERISAIKSTVTVIDNKAIETKEIQTDPKVTTFAVDSTRTKVTGRVPIATTVKYLEVSSADNEQRVSVLSKVEPWLLIMVLVGLSVIICTYRFCDDYHRHTDEEILLREEN